MEDIVNNPVFFEFFGLPGCGKSTVSHAVARLLREEGYTVEEPSFTIDHQRRIIRKIKKIAIAIGWFIVHYKVYIAIRDIVKKNGYNGTELLTQTVNVIQKIRKYNGKADARIYIWDQGLIQAALSLSANGKITAVDNYARLLPFVRSDVKIVPVYMPVTADVALKRMSDRPSNDSRVERIAGNEQKERMLKQIQDGLESVQESIAEQTVIIEDTEDIIVKVERAQQKLQESLKNTNDILLMR